MAQVSSDSVDVRRAFQRHRLASGVTGVPRRSRFVSLFYATECGLKYLLMTAGSLATTGDLKTALTASLGLPKRDIDLHNIEQLCQAAGLLPVDIGTSPLSFTVNGTAFPPYKLHEAARYGVKIADVYVVNVELWLENILDAVETRMATQGI
ncbi:hypothetical protein [Agrobacterium larrymoorei]|uniref:Uncharacterized protein n=1 Tax=Agrobacterium larrymoorei TaxID=160699 RepID=A0A4D7DXE1_9HYPH|nr:hypothetical protein [Agrobacterium larrymoorei]QCI98842.1 hypothetical protein CFBP5473_13620 [Agrobacterium larrymoorei]QYA08270.1 hypothetical protein J5285_06115 [Agrobacterium larrymoorei]